MVMVGGVHSAASVTCAEQPAWQSASTWHFGGESWPSQRGALAVPVHSPLQRSSASHITSASAENVQVPRHSPMQVAEQEPSQVPMQVPPQVPMQVPMQLPSPSMALHSPSQLPMQ